MTEWTMHCPPLAPRLQWYDCVRLVWRYPYVQTAERCRALKCAMCPIRVCDVSAAAHTVTTVLTAKRGEPPEDPCGDKV